jgi:hypothetical protein
MNADDQITTESKQVPLGAVMSLLGQNTKQRNIANADLHYANKIIRESKEGHFATLGRIVKYEGLPIIEEALEYARTSGLFINCNSKYLNIKTKIEPYYNKKGQKSLAHYTIYGSFLEKAKDGDEPKFYTGNFLYKDYAEHLEQYRNNSVKNFNKLADLFDFTGQSNISKNENEFDEDKPIATLIKDKQKKTKKLIIED